MDQKHIFDKIMLKHFIFHNISSCLLVVPTGRPRLISQTALSKHLSQDSAAAICRQKAKGVCRQKELKASCHLSPRLQ
jgi:hypothetical protein